VISPDLGSTSKSGGGFLRSLDEFDCGLVCGDRVFWTPKSRASGDTLGTPGSSKDLVWYFGVEVLLFGDFASEVVGFDVRDADEFTILCFNKLFLGGNARSRTELDFVWPSVRIVGTCNL
jgi:hypothetical protein